MANEPGSRFTLRSVNITRVLRVSTRGQRVARRDDAAVPLDWRGTLRARLFVFTLVFALVLVDTGGVDVAVNQPGSSAEIDVIQPRLVPLGGPRAMTVRVVCGDFIREASRGRRLPPASVNRTLLGPADVAVRLGKDAHVLLQGRDEVRHHLAVSVLPRLAAEGVCGAPLDARPLAAGNRHSEAARVHRAVAEVAGHHHL